MAVEADLIDALVLHADVHAQLIAAEWVVLERLEVVWLELAEVAGTLVVVEDVIPI